MKIREASDRLEQIDANCQGHIVSTGRLAVKDGRLIAGNHSFELGQEGIEGLFDHLDWSPKPQVKGASRNKFRASTVCCQFRSCSVLGLIV